MAPRRAAPAAELDPAEACAADPSTGELKYGWSNVCLHYFRRAWLASVADRLAAEGRYHIAHKKIPSKDGPVQVGRGGAGRGGAMGWEVRPFLAMLVSRQQQLLPGGLGRARA